MSLVLKLHPDDIITRDKVYKDLGCDDIDGEIFRKDYQSISHRIDNLFSWHIGGRILEPEFGNYLEYIKYESLNEVTLKNAEAGIRRMLGFETEITIQNIILTPNEDQNELHIRVDYFIPKLNLSTTKQLTVSVVSGDN